MFKTMLLSIFVGAFFFSAANAQKDSDWGKFKPADEAASVSLPCTPTASTETFSSEGGSIKQTIYSCAYGSTFYAFSVATFAVKPTDAKLTLDQFRDGLVGSFGTEGKIITEKTVTLDTHPGREFSVNSKSSKGEMSGKVRLYLVGAKLYAVLLGRMATEPSAASDDTYLSSLALEK